MSENNSGTTGPLNHVPGCVTRYVEVTIPATFDEESETIFDAIGQGAQVGELELISRSVLQNRLDRAKLFYTELLEAEGTLGSVAEKYGLNTLTDLMHLQTAIISDSTIEAWPDESRVCEVIKGLPSGDAWMQYTDLPESWKEHCVRVEPSAAPPHQDS